MISIKTPDDIEKMRETCRLAARTLDMVGKKLSVGMNTEEVNTIVHDFIIENDAIPSPLNYHGFPKSICTSVNHVICHGIPADKKLKDGDIINIDITVIKDGYHGDTSKMFIVGKPSIRADRLCKLTQEALYLGMEQVKPGATLGDIGHVIETFAHKHQLSVVREYCGHGIGKIFHEEPQVLHYGRPGTGMVLKQGMCFTIEPMLNLGKRHSKLLQDGWTVVTKDRSLSAQWEHTIGVTDNGFEVFTARSEESWR